MAVKTSDTTDVAPDTLNQILAGLVAIGGELKTMRSEIDALKSGATAQPVQQEIDRSPAAVRKFAAENGIPVPARGRIPNAVYEKFDAAHSISPTVNSGNGTKPTMSAKSLKSSEWLYLSKMGSKYNPKPNPGDHVNGFERSFARSMALATSGNGTGKMSDGPTDPMWQRAQKILDRLVSVGALDFVGR